MNEFVPDSIVQTIIERFRSRAEFGFKKYNTDLDRKDLSPEQWAQHAIEEAHDFMLYMEKWKLEQAKQKRLVDLLMKDSPHLSFEGLSGEEVQELADLYKWYKEHQKL
jgi:hypothetical protein